MIFRSPFPDIEIPEISLPSFALQQAGRLASKPAMIDGITGQSITYGQLEILTRRLAIGLAERGFGRDDVLAIYSPNTIEYPVAIYGALAAGGMVTTINPLFTTNELAVQLADSRATYLIATPESLPAALEAAEATQVREVFTFGEAEGARPFDVLLADDGPWPAVEIDPREDVALLPYSSGTGGLPKCVMHTMNRWKYFHKKCPQFRSDDVFTDPPTSPAMYALATLPYLVAVLLARVVGDAATARFGAPSVVRAGALTAFVGLAVVVFAPASSWPVAILGFFVVGLGVAAIAPLAFSAAARVADEEADPALHRARVDAVVARFNQFNYAGALIGSVLTGALGSTSLRVGFAVPMVLVLALVPLARHFATAGSLD